MNAAARRSDTAICQGRPLLTSPEHSTYEPGARLAFLKSRLNQEILAEVIHRDQANQAPIADYRHRMAIASLQALEHDLQHLRGFRNQEHPAHHGGDGMVLPI